MNKVQIGSILVSRFHAVAFNAEDDIRVYKTPNGKFVGHVVVGSNVETLTDLGYDDSTASCRIVFYKNATTKEYNTFHEVISWLDYDGFLGFLCQEGTIQI